MRNSSAFTLIELLIVVAIIAILAAIAVPNFRNARIRARVVQTKSNQRVVAMALEEFYLENKKYIGSTGHGDNFKAWKKLTTPVAYMASMEVCRDPFYIKYNDTKSEHDQYFELAEAKKSRSNLVSYCIEGTGPDLYDSISTPNYGNPESTFIPYMSSNGLESIGDIFRVGGTWIPDYVVRFYADQMNG